MLSLCMKCKCTWGRNWAYGQRNGVVEDPGATGSVVDAMKNPSPLRLRVGEGRYQRRKHQKLAEDVDGVSAIGEPPRGSPREVDPVGRVICPRFRVPQEVVVPVVHQRAPEHKHPLHCRLVATFAPRKQRQGGEGHEEKPYRCFRHRSSSEFVLLQWFLLRVRGCGS